MSLVRVMKALVYVTTDGEMHFSLSEAHRHQIAISGKSQLHDALEEPMFLDEPTPGECEGIALATIRGNINHRFPKPPPEDA